MSSEEAINPVLLDIADDIAVVTMTSEKDPQRHVAASLLSRTQCDALDEIEERRADEVRCVVLTGIGKRVLRWALISSHWRRPGDVRRRRSARSRDRDGSHVSPAAPSASRALHCPLITAVNGVAAGGGMSLALMGDLVVTAESASFVQSFRHIGLAPDMGATFLLPRLVGLR